jgi:hypothetical protein
LYFYARAEPDVAFFKSFEYAAGFYARRPLEVLHDLDAARAGDAVWFIATEPDVARLRDLPARSFGRAYRLTELDRYTYGDNAKRTPLVYVEACPE